MTLFETMEIAWEGLTLNKVRSFLTTLGVIIGVASVIMMLAVSAGAEAAIAEQINSLGADLIIVGPLRGTPGAAKSFVYEDAQAIAENVRGIIGVSAEQFSTQDVKGGSGALEAISILGVTTDFPQVRDYELFSGQFFTADDNERKTKVAVLGYGIARDLFGTQDPFGQPITIGSTRFTVIGVMEQKGFIGDVDYDGRIYIPIAVVFQKFTTMAVGSNRVRTVYVKAESREKMDSVIAQITAVLAERHDVDPARPDFSVETQQDIIATQEATTETFRDLLAWVAGVSLMVGGIGIMNIMLVSVTERTREIGLRQSLGARPQDVRLQFLLEAVILSLAGGLVGVLVGIGGTYLFGELGTMRTELVPASIPLAFGAAAAVGIFFGYYPATQAAQLDPIVALRRD
ncbi:MAG: ABC transporter permease [Thermoflexales bacterium]|nr:ABC transporter permease [Thermoflexales bacterium]